MSRCRTCFGTGEVYTLEKDPDGSHWIECEDCDGYSIEVTPRSRRAYLAIKAEATRVGWPAYYKRDLTYWDRNALDGRDPSLPFGWILRETGTFIIAPHGSSGVLSLVKACEREGNQRFYWWDGVTLCEVSADQLCEQWARACASPNG